MSDSPLYRLGKAGYRRLKPVRRFREIFHKSESCRRPGLESSKDNAPAAFRFADLELDAGRRSVVRDDQAIALPRKSFDMLLALVDAAPDNLSIDELMDRVWRGAVVNQATVAKRVELLRQALGEDSSEPRYVALVRGHGYRLIPEAKRAQREPPECRRWLTAAIAALLATAAIVTGWFALQPDVPADRSVVVLPFAVITQDAETEMFAEGLADELRHVLSSRNKLRVIGRSSSVCFEDRDDDLRTIGETLSVAHILEGSIRRTVDRLRINATLTDASDGFTLWSESYDRDLAGANEIQEDTALNVAAQLRVVFGETGQPAAPDPDVIDPGAYALYLRAVSLSPYGKFRDLGDAQRLTEEVTRLAPEFAPGWNRLAAIHGRRLFGGDPGYGLSPDKTLEIMRDAVDRALAIDPESAESYANLGGMAWVFEGDAPKAAPLIQRALSLDAGHLDIVAFAAEFAKYIGHFQQALLLEERIMRRDPLCGECRLRLAQSYLYSQRYADAAREFETVQELQGGGYNWHFGIASLMLERPQQALELFESISLNANPHLNLAGRAAALCSLGRDAEARAVLDELVERVGELSPLVTARAFAHCGEADAAFEWLERSLPQGTVELQVDFPDPLFARLRDDPRWNNVMQRIGRSKEQTEAISFSLDVALPDFVARQASGTLLPGSWLVSLRSMLRATDRKWPQWLTPANITRVGVA